MVSFLGRLISWLLGRLALISQYHLYTSYPPRARASPHNDFPCSLHWHCPCLSHSASWRPCPAPPNVPWLPTLLSGRALCFSLPLSPRAVLPPTVVLCSLFQHPPLTSSPLPGWSFLLPSRPAGACWSSLDLSAGFTAALTSGWSASCPGAQDPVFSWFPPASWLCWALFSLIWGSVHGPHVCPKSQSPGWQACAGQSGWGGHASTPCIPLPGVFSCLCTMSAWCPLGIPRQQQAPNKLVSLLLTTSLPVLMKITTHPTRLSDSPASPTFSPLCSLPLYPVL